MAVPEAPPEQAAARLKICERCQWYTMRTRRCKKMSGQMERRVKILSSQCPLRAWRGTPFVDTRTISLGTKLVNRYLGKAISDACGLYGVDIALNHDARGYERRFKAAQSVMTWGFRNYSPGWYAAQKKNVLFVENGLFHQRDGCFIDSAGFFASSSLCKNREWEREPTPEEIERIRKLAKDWFKWDILSYAYRTDGPILYCVQLDRDAPCQYYFPAKSQGMDNIASGLKILAEHCPDREVIIRPHPSHASLAADRRDWDRNLRLYKLLFRPNWRIEAGGSVYLAIKKASAVVTINSTVATEALSLGIPVATLGEGAFTGSGVTLECAKAPERLRELDTWGKREGCDRAAYNKRALGYLAAVMRHQLSYKAKAVDVLKNESFTEWVMRVPTAKAPIALPQNLNGAIPKLLHFIWIGSKLPDWAQFNIEQWRKMNPDYGVMIHDESVLHSDFSYGYNRRKRNDHKADILKWSALYQYGGWTIDLDTVPLRPMSHLTNGLNGNTDFLAVEAPPDDARGRLRCDMGLIGANRSARVWPHVAAYLGGMAKVDWGGGYAVGGIGCMDYLLKTVPGNMTRRHSRIYCPYSRKHKEWMWKGKCFIKALRAGWDVTEMVAEYDAAFSDSSGKPPLAWHVWRGAVA